MFEGNVHGGAADRTDGAEDENIPTRLDFDGALDELRAGEQDNRQCGRLLEAEFVRDACEHAGLSSSEFGVSAVGYGHDALTSFKSNDAFSGADHLTGEIVAEDGGQLDIDDSLHGATAGFQVDGIDAGGAHADQDFASADLWVVYGLNVKLIHAAETIDHDCFHDCISISQLSRDERDSGALTEECGVARRRGMIAGRDDTRT